MFQIPLEKQTLAREHRIYTCNIKRRSVCVLRWEPVYRQRSGWLPCGHGISTEWTPDRCRYIWHRKSIPQNSPPPYLHPFLSFQSFRGGGIQTPLVFRAWQCPRRNEWFPMGSLGAFSLGLLLPTKGLCPDLFLGAANISRLVSYDWWGKEEIWQKKKIVGNFRERCLLLQRDNLLKPKITSQQ